MVQVTYPGVYVVEVPSGVHTIAGVSTSVAAFVDRFIRGPDNRAVQIFGLTDFAREFGGLATYSPASYAIQQFFLNGGTEAWVTRVGRTAGTNVYEAATATLDAGGAAMANVFAGRQLRGESVANPGSWGNALRLEVDYNTAILPNASIDPTNVLTQTELFNLTVSLVAERNGRTVVVEQETYTNLTFREDVPTNALSVVNDNSRLVQLDRTGLAALPAPPAAPNRPDPTGTLGDVPVLPVVLPASGSTVIFDLDPDGTGGSVLEYTGTVTYPTPAPAGADFNFIRPFLETAIRNAVPTLPASPTGPNNPLLAGATVQAVQGQLRILLGRGGAGFSPAGLLEVTGGTGDFQLTPAQGGFVGPQQLSLATSIPTSGDGGPITDGELRGVQATKRGLYALEDVSIFNILCLPAAADLAATEMFNTYSEAAAYCEERRAFLIVDIPENISTLDDMQGWLTDNDGLRHRNAAVYFPRVRIADPLNGSRLRSVAASGTLAGVYARTDGTRGVWKAPAGIEAQLRGVQELAAKLTDRENGALNPLAANVLRSFPVYGIVSWGARTLEGADQRGSEWKYIPIRRLALFLEESLFRGTKWVVFEPNDEPLWAQIRMNLRAFMMGLFRQGAFQGSTPDQAFFVKCDGETTTQADRNLGIVNVEVGFAPLKPAEFVILRIQQIAGDLG